VEWPIPEIWEGERADKVLASLSGASRAAARMAIELGAVTLDNEEFEVRRAVKAGEVFSGEIPERHTPLEPEPIDFGVVYEDSDLAIIDKPFGIVTHPGAGNRGGTLASGLLHRWPTIRGVGQEDRWGIVHRLDRDTSGLLIIALTGDSYEALSTAIRRREVTREYLGLVNGVPGSPSGTIDAPINRDPRRPTRMRIDADGRSAVTHYRVEQQWAKQALLRVTLETGRTHQIRVHLASIGLPVAGDRVYGSAPFTHRLFLHATRLAFSHPRTGRDMEAESPLPSDLATVTASETR
jgi:23S rRNA pseudouridine1911/1915/1917 synthase